MSGSSLFNRFACVRRSLFLFRSVPTRVVSPPRVSFTGHIFRFASVKKKTKSLHFFISTNRVPHLKTNCNPFSLGSPCEVLIAVSQQKKNPPGQKKKCAR
jgi:hypothetical protein